MKKQPTRIVRKRMWGVFTRGKHLPPPIVLEDRNNAEWETRSDEVVRPVIVEWKERAK